MIGRASQDRPKAVSAYASLHRGKATACASAAALLAGLLLTAPAACHSSGTSPRAVVNGYLTASHRSRNTSRFLAPKAGSVGDGCYSVATERWRLRGVRRYGNSAEVHVEVWKLAEFGCDGSTRYWPPKRERLAYGLRRTSGEWKLVSYHPILTRAEAAKYRRSPFYLVIAGSFRDAGAASRHAAWVARKAGDDIGPVVRDSETLAGLRPGWKVVVPADGECFSRAEASAVRTRLAAAGAPAYVARIR